MGIPGPYDAVVRLAFESERVLGRDRRCRNEGGGRYETRDEYLHVYEANELTYSVQEATYALVTDARNTVAVTTAKAALVARVATGQASPSEARAAALPDPRVVAADVIASSR